MKVLLTGATGFVGSEILKQLIEAGHQIRVVLRDQSSPFPIENPQIEPFYGNIIHAPSLAGSMNGIEAVIHIVGVIAEFEENTFDRVHRIGTQNVVNEAKKASVKRFIHMSSLGTRETGRSRYHQSKWAAEEIVRSSGMDWTIFRPSVIYGPGDSFVNLFAGMMRFPGNLVQLFTIPLIEGATNLLQPVPVEDVVRCFVGALGKPESIKKTYDLCGPAPITTRETLLTIAKVLGKDTLEVKVPLPLLPFGVLKGLFLQPKVIFIHLPLVMAKLIAWKMETFLSKPPLTRDQLIMIQEDNVGNPAEAMRDFGIQPPEFEKGISAYLKP